MKNRRYEVGIGGSGLDELIQALDDYPKWLEQKAEELSKRLAEMGALNAEFYYSGALYAGNTDCRIEVTRTGEYSYQVLAEGESVLFIEFGAGAKHGYGHPEAKQAGMGPGTWPDKHYRVGKDGKLIANWENPSGWFTPDGIHTYGNPPAAFMYRSVKDLKESLKSVIQEVFLE